MAIAEELTEDTIEEGETSKDGEKLSLPELTNPDAVETFKQSLDTGRRGVPTLIKRLELWQLHQKLSNAAKRKIETSIRFINGEVIPRDRRFKLTNLTDEEKLERSLRMGSKKYYNALLEQEHGDKLLKQQCKLFNLDVTEFETLEDMIEALVEKNLELAKE